MFAMVIKIDFFIILYILLIIYCNIDMYISLGIYYGYPDCCIKQFMNFTDKKNNQHEQTEIRKKSVDILNSLHIKSKGFVPCLSCCKKLQQDKTLSICNLIKNRECIIPYNLSKQKIFNPIKRDFVKVIKKLTFVSAFLSSFNYDKKTIIYKNISIGILRKIYKLKNDMRMNKKLLQIYSNSLQKNYDYLDNF